MRNNGERLKSFVTVQQRKYILYINIMFNNMHIAYHIIKIVVESSVKKLLKSDYSDVIILLYDFKFLFYGLSIVKTKI